LKFYSHMIKHKKEIQILDWNTRFI
jgi:hypothetical protein